MKRYIIFFALFAFLVTGPSGAQERKTDNKFSAPITITGTVRRFSDSGSFYGIEGDDGSQYKPNNLTSGFQVEGLRIKARAQIIQKKFLFKPQYTPINLIDIERVSGDEVAGKRVYANPLEPIKVNAGEVFIIKLAANHTTGYTWKLKKPLDKNVVKWQDVHYVTGDNTGIMVVGSGGEERWVFKATGAGETTLSFDYVRPWEKKVPPAKNISFKIIVRSGQ